MKILHISDIHFREHYEYADQGYESVLYRMQSPLCAIDTCLQSLHDESIDLVLISGDLCDHGTVKDYRILKAYLFQHFFNIPIIACPGNHDIIENFKLGWLDEPTKNEINQVLELDNLVVLSLDNTSGDANGEIHNKQIQWLEKQFHKFFNKPILLMMHHHIIKEQASIPSVLLNEVFVSLIKQNPLVGIVCGHTHYSFEGNYEGIAYFTAPGMSFCGEDVADGTVRFVEKFGYHLYDYEKGTMQCCCKKTFYDGKLLNTIRF